MCYISDRILKYIGSFELFVDISNCKDYSVFFFFFDLCR